MAPGDGLKSALDAIVAQEPRDPAGPPADALDQAKQLPLLPADGAEGSVQVLPGEGGDIARAGPGRPKGSRNKSTDEWIKHYFEQGLPDPMLWLGRELARPIEAMAKEMRIKVGEAHERKIKIAGELMPYIHQKLPQAVNIEKGVTVVHIHTDLPMGGVAGAPRVPETAEELRVVKVIENQPDNEGDSS